jgi:hypothetical protein
MYRVSIGKCSECDTSKGQFQKIFASYFFQPSSPKPLKISLGSYQILLKIPGLFASQGTHCTHCTGGKFSISVHDIHGDLSSDQQAEINKKKKVGEVQSS